MNLRLRHFPKIHLPDLADQPPPERCPICDAVHVAADFFAEWNDRPQGTFSYKCGAAYAPPDSFFDDLPPTSEQLASRLRHVAWLMYEECSQPPPLRTLAVLCLWHQASLDMFQSIASVQAWLTATAIAYTWPAPPIWLSLGDWSKRDQGAPPINCPVCGATEIPNTPFCSSCGTAFETRESQFCKACGTWNTFLAPVTEPRPQKWPFDYHQYRCNATYHASGVSPFPNKDHVERYIPISWTGSVCYRPPPSAVIEAVENQLADRRSLKRRLGLFMKPAAQYQDVLELVRKVL